MRPCCQCRTPIENRATVCPHCGSSQVVGLQVNPSGGPPKRGWLGQLLRDVRDLIDSATPLRALIAVPVLIISHPWLVLPLVAGGLIGYYLGGYGGAAVGVIAAMVLFIAVVAWRDHRRGR